MGVRLMSNSDLRCPSMRKPRYRNWARRGVTLIEVLLIILVIIGVMIVSLLALSFARSKQASQSANSMAGDRSSEAFTTKEAVQVAAQPRPPAVSLPRVQEKPPAQLSARWRVACASNLMGIGLGLASYAAANNDTWPIPDHLAAIKDEIGRVRYAPGKIGSHRGQADKAAAGETNGQDTEMSTTRSLWTLVRSGDEPKRSICPSSPTDQPNTEDNPQSFWDFRNYREVSYGYQVPFGKHGRPGPNVDPDMALVADKGPYGAVLESGQPNPAIASPTASDSPDNWRANSPNHFGEGQNVMFNDGHVEFFTTPLAGVDLDNIYTRWASANAGRNMNELSRVRGTPPTGIETPWAATDSLIYP